ncbi:MAG TPA: glycosyltransferase family A protein [Thermoanaerobaculia bacterium]|nr:glycosyltransferase family A protein [Thermoanaerobaculia bacterium]
MAETARRGDSATVRPFTAMLVTTIIPVFNRPAMLREAVGSVLAQTYRPIEIIIVDDGSTDETPAVADALAREHPEVRVIHQTNRGVGPARDAGRRAARGEFIQHLDSDDLLYPRKFELQVAGLDAHPECGVSYCWTRTRQLDGTFEPHSAKRTGERVESMFPAMLEQRWWHTPTPLYRASLIQRAGEWLALRNEEDWEYDARIASFGVRLHYVEEWLVEVRQHSEDRLSARGLERAVLRDRATAHARILEHAQRAGITPDAPEMRRYARELFLLSRQCGAAGLREESKMLFALARDASGDRRNHAQFRLYALATKLLGWQLTGRLACMTDRLR